MKNLLINITSDKKFNYEHSITSKIQIENSLGLGWKKEDILIVTNFSFEYMGISSIVIDDDTYCDVHPRASKINAILKLFEKNIILKDEIYWYHDFDAFQTQEFNEIEEMINDYDLGLTDYGWSEKWNTGSFFFKHSSRDIFEEVKKEVYKNNFSEEMGFMAISDEKIKSRWKRLNISYNFGVRKILYNYNLANKTVNVAHFHPCKIRHLNLFLNGQNDANTILLPEGLIKIFNKYGFK